jgi:hypothetical protein
MKYAIALTTALLCAAAASSASAQNANPKIEPGLWELAFKLRSENGQIEAAMRQVQQQLAMMPPEQRKRMEAMLAAKGVKLGDQINTVQACISKEDAEKGEVPQQAGACTQQVLERGNNSMKVAFSCATSPPAKGEGVVTFQSPTAYTSQAIVDTEMAGMPQRINVDQAGKWLGADCGSVQPFGR